MMDKETLVLIPLEDEILQIWERNNKLESISVMDSDMALNLITHKSLMI